MTSITLPAGGTVAREFDGRGNQTGIRTAAGALLTSSTFGALGELLTETDRSGSSVYEYRDGSPEPASTARDGGVHTMAYDDNNNLIRVVDEIGAVSSFRYDAADRPTTSDYGNGTSTRLEYGAPIDLSRIPLDDKDVFAEIQRADTVGTFQIESRAQMQSLLRTKPATIDDLTAWSGPWGVSYTANLTPDTLTGLRSGVWTEGLFIKALRTGKHMGTARNILPPMPWQFIGQLSDDDLKAIWAYLGTIPAINNHVPDPISPAAAR